MLTIPTFEQAQILVLGDVMLDRYWQGQAQRISPEAPVPIVNLAHDDAHTRPGGAANVAVNLTALGAKATLLGLVGDDAAAQDLAQGLSQAGVTHELLATAQPTITKLRVLSHQQQLMRLDFEKPYQVTLEHVLHQQYQAHLANVNCVVLSDYNKGTLTHIRALIDWARQKNLPVIVDPKGNDFARYQGASILTPNRKEFEAIVGPCQDDADIVEKGAALLKQLDLQALLITRGAEGMTLLQRDAQPVHLTARAREVFDVTGAGDTVVAALAGALAAGASYADAAMLANTAGSIVVGKLGTATANAAEITQALAQSKGLTPVYSEADIVKQIKEAKLRGERVVMTNGCFDLVHAGHVACINAARNLGDRLLVAINSDDSIRRLKGESRPIMSEADRQQVLASLSAVDWVLPFEDDTPERLLQLIKPDVLVKGGDYMPEQVVGADIVKSYGGQVEVLKHAALHCSTTKIIEKVVTKEAQDAAV